MADLNLPRNRPRLLDLFCCEGGAAMGYHRAGFDVIGVDIEPQPRYPFEFIQADVLDMLGDDLAGEGFDAIHASPPCQAYSDLQRRTGREYPRLLEPVRELLERLNVHYVIENVVGAPLRDPVLLCGTMFPELRVERHRLFETNWPLAQPHHVSKAEHPLVFTHDKRKAHYGRLDQDTSYVQVTGGGNATIANKRDAMGTPWMSGHGCNEAIPPAYTQYVGEQLINYWRLGTEVAA